MNLLRKFDLLESPLRGTNLIEASAGTGKTYTITGLFLRLLLEMSCPVSQVLVVTFTEAATGELKDRIRSKLREAAEVFSGGGSRDAFLMMLRQRCEDQESAMACLDDALKSFDQAPIFTIHGFCRRVLHEFAFESGTAFHPELITDQEDIKREIIDDFWRTHFFGARPLFVHHALQRGFHPDALSRLIARGTGQPYLRVIPEVEFQDTRSQEKRFQETFCRAAESWHGARDEVKEILEGNKELNRTRYPPDRIPLWVAAMDHCLDRGPNNPSLFDSFKKFTITEIRAGTKKDKDPPDHPFFHICQDLADKQAELQGAFDRCLLALKVMLFSYVRDRLPSRKEERNVQHFDDLLIKLEEALGSQGGEALARAVAKKFKAALIDEFQDTDPVQYAIFRRIFRRGDSTLYFIGDPKQAIYGFRGADIFTYMAAAREIKGKYTLEKNWRSEPGLIRAINAIFSSSKRPFIYREIGFQPVEPADREEQEVLRMDPDNREPLQIWFLDPGKLAKPGEVINKGEARGVIRRGVAGEISRLLHLGRQGKAFIGNRPLEERDIAVLVRRNNEAEVIQRDLAALNIPSIIYSSANVFESHEALEMERVLSSIAEPSNEGLFKAALATDILGMKGESLEALMGDDAAWEERLVAFRQYRDLWHEYGFMRMFRNLLFKERVLVHLMAYGDGERRCTNLLHLQEVLHRISVEKKLDVTGLLKWFMEQRRDTGARLEEEQLRLESDENAVRVVTMHRCKGLEYPVVFCPFTWDGSLMKRSVEFFTFHDEGDEMRLTLDLGSKEKEEHLLRAEKELLSENLRLLYVALTRAMNRCYLVWGRIKEAETSAPAYLFYGGTHGEEVDLVKKTGGLVGSMTDEELRLGLVAVQERAKRAIGLSDIPCGEGVALSHAMEEERVIEHRRFHGEINRQWKVSSFSSLTSGQRHGAELPDHDAEGETEEPEAVLETEGRQDATDIFSFPKGTRAGIFFHDIFENLDFTWESSLVRELVSRKLGAYGFDPKWLDTVCGMIRKVLSLPLDPKEEGFCLSAIPYGERLNELEFYFPMKQISSERLRELFEGKGMKNSGGFHSDYLGRLEFSPTKGFMKGFMDMVFAWKSRYYLVDWKSNFLGPSTEDYDQSALSLSMEENLYYFQYHIYTLALDRYLELRVPGYRYENDFGGVYYIFLRGVDPGKGPDYGIFRDRPAAQWIRALGEALMARDREQG